MEPLNPAQIQAVSGGRSMLGGVAVALMRAAAEAIADAVAGIGSGSPP